MLSSLRICYLPFPLLLTPSPLPLNPYLLLTLTFVLFTLRLALLSEIADDQPSRLAKPSLPVPY
jgi:hypothetical protein